MLEKKAAQADISREVGINTFFLGEYLQQAKNFSKDDLKKIFDDLYYCDVASKTGGGQPYSLMHNLVFAICKGGL